MTARPLVAALAISCLLAGCVPPPTRSTPGRMGLTLDEEVALESSRLRERAEHHLREQQRRVERVGRRLLETIPGNPKVQFVIVSGDPSINAGASFGQVAVTSGMLSFIESDDEMAIVLGHEIAHIQQGHVMKGMMSGLALNVLAIVLETQVPGAGQAAGGVGQLFLNRFTQTQERAADDVGLQYAYAAGYDPRAAVDIQERLAVEAPQSMTAGYFDTHPSSVERAVAARRGAEELLRRGDPPGREEVLALERAAESARRRAADTRPDEQSFTRRERPAEAPRRAAQADSEACRRAAIYVDMAREAETAEERRELENRARRYCPELAEAGRARERSRSDDDSAGSVDTY